MKAVCLALCLFILSADAVVNQPSQEAQRREAPAQSYGAPPQQYGPPKPNRLQVMQRLIAAMRNGGGYASQGRVVNRPRPIPISQPPNSYGPPQNSYGAPSSSSGSLASFMNSHNPDVRCDGWVPIPGPSVGAGDHHSGGGSASSAGQIESSYGPPRHGSGNSGLNTQIIVVPDDSYSGSNQEHGSGGSSGVSASYSVSSQGHSSGGSDSYSVSNHGHSSASSGVSDSYGPPPPALPASSYGPPNHGSNGGGSAGHAISGPSDSYGAPHQGGGSSGFTLSKPTDSYGPPPPSSHHSSSNYASSSQGHSSGSSGILDSYGPPPPSKPSNNYGPPSHGHSSGGSAGISNSYGPPSKPSSNYGPPNHGHSSGGSASISNSYGPPSKPSSNYGPPNHGHSSGGSAGISNSYGPPPSKPSNNYGPPPSHGSSGGGSAGQDSYGPPPPSPVYIASHESHSSQSGHSSHQSVSSIDSSYGAPPVGHTTYGVPGVQPKAPLTSYEPAASGNSHSESHGHSSQGHASGIQTIQSIGQDLELPGVDSGDHFNNAIGLVTSSLGVSAGQNEVVQSHAIHESHTSELTNNFNGADSYTAPPLDSYAPGKYAPSFLKPRPLPSPPSQSYLPQRPPSRPQYVPPVPLKLSRPQPPQQQYRPQFNSHAQSIAQGYSSGHSQSIHAAGSTRGQQPRYPLPHRAPVPQGLFQSIGQHVQSLDEGHRGQGIGNTYIPPPTSDVPIPPMRLSVPSHGPAQPFLSQHQLQSSGSAATSSSSYSFQNHEGTQIHVIHDCGKGPKLSESYGTPLGQPLTNYQAAESSQSHGLSSNYEIPQVALEVPQQNSIDFNSAANSYGPPASGPASLDVLGLESQHRANTVISSEQQQISDIGTESQVSNEGLPGLTDGLSGSGLDFLSAQKSQSIDLPAHGGQVGNFELQFTQSHSDQNNNRIDAPSHQQILADGLLQSILTAIEQKPVQAVPQVTEDQETDHSEVQVFLKSPEGQEVLADKPAASSEEH